MQQMICCISRIKFWNKIGDFHYLKCWVFYKLELIRFDLLFQKCILFFFQIKMQNWYCEQDFE